MNLAWLRATLLALLCASAFAQQINQDIVPASTGLKLGHSNQRWNGFFNNVDVNNLTVNGVGVGTGSATWGSITGTLSNQTDLLAALNLKAPLASPTFTGAVTFPAGFNIQSFATNQVSLGYTNQFLIYDSPGGTTN